MMADEAATQVDLALNAAVLTMKSGAARVAANRVFSNL